MNNSPSLILFVLVLSAVLILSPLFLYRDNFLIPIFLVVFLISFGVNKSTIFYGLIYSFIFEIISRADFGSYLLPFFLCGLVFLILTRFINIEPTIDKRNFFRIFGLKILFILLFLLFFSVASTLIYGFLFGDSWSIRPIFIKNLFLFINVLSWSVVLVMFLSFFSDSRKSKNSNSRHA